MIAELAADVALFLFLVCWLPDRFFIAGRIGRIPRTIHDDPDARLT